MIYIFVINHNSICVIWVLGKGQMISFFYFHNVPTMNLIIELKTICKLFEKCNSLNIWLETQSLHKIDYCLNISENLIISLQRK